MLSDRQHAEPRHIEVDVRVTVDITIKPDVDPFARVTGPEGDEFRAQTYGYLTDQAAVLGHWAFNAVTNGVTDASSLDGWADLSRGDVTFDVTDFEEES